MAEFHYAISTAATSYPITVDECKMQLRIDHDYEDEWLFSAIAAAVEVVEHDLDRQIMAATWTLALDDFPVGSTPIVIDKAPLTSVTSITYYDKDNVSQTWASTNYYVSTSEPGRICLTDTSTYPETEYRPDAVTVTFVAGYSTIPETIRLALKLIVGEWYENREDLGIIPMGIQRILDTQRYTLDLGAATTITPNWKTNG